jgi:hypothetical protein
MAALLLAGGIIAYSAYTLANTKSEIENIIENRGSDARFMGFQFTRPPKSDLFTDLDTLALSPDMPLGGVNPSSTPFEQIKPAYGIFGIPKRLLRDKNNTLFTVYAGTEYRLNDV